MKPTKQSLAETLQKCLTVPSDSALNPVLTP